MTRINCIVGRRKYLLLELVDYRQRRIPSQADPRNHSGSEMPASGLPCGRAGFESQKELKSMLLSGKLDISPAIMHDVKLSDCDRAFELAQSGKTGKIVFDI